ncbi:hypothetical protein BKA00_003112 [Actinomadura coerulea]|uniref:DUF3800 domain-containing protein n=1 Tax=Actinomadura coerulea TaxID=46159 RepID=A0A7X0KZ79_9ACTN|nr:DUF3800 domain-containing protein [Actinomadura coerulea]MBB6396198.1 hypothetical protein [Actinomadura coerulea]
MIYIDDSGQKQPRRQHLGELISVGGVIVPEHAVAAFATALDSIRADLKFPDGEEIKWKPPKGTFQASAGGPLITELRQRMLQAAIDGGIKSAVVVWDRGRLPWEKADVEPAILTYLYDRISLYLRQHDDVGIIIADQPGGSRKDEMKWLADTLGLTREGTRFATPDRVVSPILTAPSHHVPHLQLADLVTAATTAAVAGYPAGTTLAPWLKKLARTNAYGLVGGAGVVLWPRDDLLDLYYWIFGEQQYVKNGTGYALGPSDDPFRPPGRPFQDDDGLPVVDTTAG